MLTDEKIKEIAEKYALDAKQHINTDFDTTVSGPQFLKDHQAIFEAAIREALAEDGWVKVTPETMPPLEVPVLAFSRRHNTYVVIRSTNADDETKWIFCSGGWIADEDVTHWRELPAPPTKETKDV